MEQKRVISIGIVWCVLWMLAVSPAGADQLRYMDRSGNIRFADSIDQVPRQYRQQIYPATPTPVLDRKAQAELKRRQQEEANHKMQLEREKKREAERRRAELERERQREERELRRREEASSVTRSGR